MNLTKRLDMYRKLPGSIYVLVIIRLINSMGNFVYPFLTFFLTERVGLSTEAAGTYFLFSAAAQSIGSITGGKLTDHFGRKKLLLLSLGLSAACFIPCTLLGNSILIPVLLVLSGIFSGAAQPINTAMVTDLSSRENRKMVFSLLYMGSNIGFAIGPMIAGFLYRKHTNWIFYGNSTAILISMVLIFILIDETMPKFEYNEQTDEQTSEDDDEGAEEGGVIRALLKRPVLLFFSVGRFIYQLVYSCINFAIPLQLKSAFGSTIGPQYFGIIMSFNGVIVIIFTLLITRLTIRMKPLVNMALAGLFYALGFGMIGFINTFPMYLVSALIYTIGEILDITNAGVYVANHSPVTHRGRFNAVISLIISSGFALGPYLFGKFLSVFSLFKLWILLFCLSAGASLFMIWLRFFQRRIDSKHHATCKGENIISK